MCGSAARAVSRRCTAGRAAATAVSKWRRSEFRGASSGRGDRASARGVHRRASFNCGGGEYLRGAAVSEPAASEPAASGPALSEPRAERGGPAGPRAESGGAAVSDPRAESGGCGYGTFAGARVAHSGLVFQCTGLGETVRVRCLASGTSRTTCLAGKCGERKLALSGMRGEVERNAAAGETNNWRCWGAGETVSRRVVRGVRTRSCAE